MAKKPKLSRNLANLLNEQQQCQKEIKKQEKQEQQQQSSQAKDHQEQHPQPQQPTLENLHILEQQKIHKQQFQKLKDQQKQQLENLQKQQNLDERALQTQYVQQLQCIKLQEVHYNKALQEQKALHQKALQEQQKQHKLAVHQQKITQDLVLQEQRKQYKLTLQALLQKQKQEVISEAIQVRKAVMPFEEEHRILLIGEGNFSFAAALATKLGNAENIIATSYDTLEIGREKYPDLEKLVEVFQEDYGGRVFYECDGTKLEKCKLLQGLGIKDQDRNIIANQTLISEFFISCKPFLRIEPRGEIIVTIKQNKLYDEWDIKTLARAVKLVCKTSFGYEHRRTLGYSKGVTPGANVELAMGARSYVFVIAGEDTLKEVIKAKAGMKRQHDKQDQHGRKSGRKKSRQRHREVESDDE